MKLKTIALGAAFAMALPFAANASTCSPTGTNFSVVNFDGSDTVNCGEYDISEGVISVIGAFSADTESAVLEFNVVGAPGALGSVDVNLFGDANDVSGMFGGMAIDFELEGTGDYTARLSSELPAMLQIVFEGAEQGSNFNLNLTPVPVPAAGFLLLGALGGLAALRRKS